jgi:hypothetical protein
MNPATIRYDSHARDQMRDRLISEAMVEAVLAKPDRITAAPPIHGQPSSSRIYWGRIGSRTLKVYVLIGSRPLLVTTVVWKGRNP